MLPAFARRRLAGEVPLARLFWWDMLAVGTLVNLVTGGTALAAYVSGVPVWAAALIFLSPLPYNLMLCLSVWRGSMRERSGVRGVIRCGAVLWLGLMLVV